MCNQYKDGLFSVKRHVPLVSVVLAVYNCSSYIKDAIDSVLSQTFLDFEFIIIDDGSNDGTEEILKTFTDDSRILLLSQKNVGLTASLRKGIEISRGKYIARQDADDISLPKRLDTQISFLEENSDFGLVGTYVDIIDKIGRVVNSEALPVNDQEIKSELMKRNCFFHGTTVFSKKAYLNVGGYQPDFIVAQDYDLWLRMVEKYKVKNIPIVLYQYRKTETSISSKMKEEQRVFMQMARDLAQHRQVKESDPP